MEVNSDGIIQYCNRVDGDYQQGKPGSSAFEGMDDPSVLREKVAEVARTGRSYQYVLVVCCPYGVNIVCRIDVKVRCPVTKTDKWFRLQMGPTIQDMVCALVSPQRD